MPIFQDHFLDNRNDWPTRNDWRVSMIVGEGGFAYVLDRRISEGYSLAWKELETMPAAAPYKLHAVLQRMSGDNHGFGLIWRGDDRENCFVFEIAAGGFFRIRERKGGEWTVTAEWQPSAALRTGNATNELMVEQLAEKAYFVVNGQKVLELDLAAPATNGGFGFLINGRLNVRVHSCILMHHVPEPEEKGAGFNEEELQVVMAELDEFIGMDNIKQEISTLVNVLKVQKLRKERELVTSLLSLHMVLAGPPGTGKTSIARLIGRIYKALGFLTKGHVVETDRSGMVASYVGQTAPKVDERVKEAMGGILFIDEAYALMPEQSDGRDFGREAIETLLKRMEDYREQFALVIAGYDDEMHRFLDANPGVRSRFNRYLYFEHYNPEELSRIFELFCAKGGYDLAPAAAEKLRIHMGQAYSRRDRTFGNGRYARNLLEKVIENQANRIINLDPISEEILRTILPEDLPPFTNFELSDPPPLPQELDLSDLDAVPLPPEAPE